MPAKKWKNGLRMAATAALAAAAIAACGSARAQSSSLFGDPQARQGQGLMMNDASWTYEVTADPRQFKINDQVTVIVSEKSSVQSQGKMNQQKQIA